MSLLNVYCLPFFSTDVIDVVKDQLHGADYLREEDPRIYVSEKTARGPLDENWVEDYWSECKVSYWLFAVKEHRAIRALRHDALLLWQLNGLELMFYLQNKSMPTPSGKALMCAYKLCRVEFHYWGMQSKIEKFIHDVGKRRLIDLCSERLIKILYSWDVVLLYSATKNHATSA